jgi:hypothetical protein
MVSMVIRHEKHVYKECDSNPKLLSTEIQETDELHELHGYLTRKQVEFVSD